MAYLDQIVDLRAVGNLRRSDCGAVDARVRLHIDVIADSHRTRLGNLLPAAIVVLSEAEAVGSDDYPVFEGDVVAEDAALADDRMRVGEEIVADPDAGVEHDVG